MIQFLAGLVVGGVIGGTLGLVLMGVLVAASRDDDAHGRG